MSESVAGAGRVLAGRYRLLSQIGRGGMGTVWCARDEVLDRDVAVKEVLIERWLGDADRNMIHQRTQREARATARLNHPGIVTVHDVIEEDGRPWIVMEFVRARSLQQIVDEDGPLPPAQVAEIGRQLIGALRTAHAVGILHRDVKPANVLLLREKHEDRAVLTDFGIAQIEGDTALTQTGLVIGSPAYIAPERANGERATPATDLWALGATLYAACEGHPPHERIDAMATLAAVLTMDVPAPRNAGPLVPTLLGLLHRDPDQRLTAETAAAMFGEVLTGSGPAETRTRPTPGAWQDPAARPWPEPSHGSPVRAPTVERMGASREPTTAARATTFPQGGLQEYPGPPPSGGLPESPPRRAGRGIHAGLLVAVAVLAGAVLVLAGFLVLRDQDGATASAGPQSGSAGTHTGGTGSAPATGPTASAGSTASAGPTGPARPAGARLPAGWGRVTGPGYSLGVPNGWRRTAVGKSVIWKDPGSASFVQVDHTDWTGDAYGHWQTWERQARADGKLRSYHRIALSRVPGADHDTADLEFTYLTQGGTPMHAVDRGVRADGQPFVVFVSIPVDQWTSRTHNVDNFLNSFRS